MVVCKSRHEDLHIFGPSDSPPPRSLPQSHPWSHPRSHPRVRKVVSRITWIATYGNVYLISYDVGIDHRFPSLFAVDTLRHFGPRILNSQIKSPQITRAACTSNASFGNFCKWGFWLSLEVSQNYLRLFVVVKKIARVTTE